MITILAIIGAIFMVIFLLALISPARDYPPPAPDNTINDMPAYMIDDGDYIPGYKDPPVNMIDDGHVWNK